MTTFAYDLAGRTLTVTDPSGAVVSTVYDAAGQVTATIDPLVAHDLGRGRRER